MLESMGSAKKVKTFQRASAAAPSVSSAGSNQKHFSAVFGGKATPGVSAAASWRLILAAAGLIVLATVAVYHNCFAAPFVYDDIGAIEWNETIRHLWPIWQALSPPRHGETVSGRPLLNLSLAINYAISGLDVWSYHAANLLIHMAAALLLFGILRRTFLMPSLRERFGKAAAPLALASTLLWTVHPLQTESITYLVQRAESLASLFYLLTLYCVIRSAGSSRSRTWSAAAVLACLVGVGCKEIVVTAPLVVLLYDRTFLAGSFARAWQQRRMLYVALAATWVPLVVLVLSTGLVFHQPEMGAPDSWSYARSQLGVVLHYLCLCVWPKSLSVSYAWPVAHTLGKILPGAIVIGLLLAATIWGVLRQKPYGFLGAWFFLILAPTSSFMPLNQLAHEHRMYLPLAAVVVLVVAGGYSCWDRFLVRRAGGQGGQSPFSPGRSLDKIGLSAAKKGTVPGLAVVAGWAPPIAILVAVLLALGCTTVLRNSDYASPLVLWRDLVSKRPEHPLAHYNLGVALADVGELHQAIQQYRETLQLDPEEADAHFNLGVALAKIGQADEAMEHYRQAIRLRSHYIDAHNNLGMLLAGAGRIDEAMEHFREAARVKPDSPDAHYNLGLALAGLGKTQEAIEEYREAVRLKPEDATAHFNLGVALAAIDRTDEAIQQYQEALRLKPDDAAFHNNLGIAFAAADRSDAALEQYRKAVRLKPTFAEAHHNLGLALAAAGKSEEAIEQYQQALRLKPDLAAARYNLASVLEGLGRTKEAIEHYHELLQREPDSLELLRNLAWLLATAESVESEDAARAVQLAQRARELSRRENVPCLDTLAAAYAAVGRFDDAVIVAQRAVQLAQSSGQASLAKAIGARLELYRAGRPYRRVADSNRN